MRAARTLLRSSSTISSIFIACAIFWLERLSRPNSIPSIPMNTGAQVALSSSSMFSNRLAIHLAVSFMLLYALTAQPICM